MKAIVIYDLTGRIWNIIYGEDVLPPGVLCMFVDIPEGAQLDKIDVTDPRHPKPIFIDTPESDIERLQKDMKEVQTEVADVQNRLGPEFNPDTASLEEAQDYMQEVNKQHLAEFLAMHPLRWTDERYYGVTQRDQEEMALDLQAYQVMIQSQPDWKLEWHDIHRACHEFTIEQYTDLLSAIIKFVYPYRRLQETYKEQIFTCMSKEEVLAMPLLYEILEDE